MRQKATTDRWNEQYVLVGEEMKQTVRTFEGKVEIVELAAEEARTVC